MKFKMPPRSATEVFNLLPEGTLAEVIGNAIYISQPRSLLHQDALGTLAVAMHQYVKSHQFGKCVCLPIDVYLGDEYILQPDIVFISTENLGIVKNDKIKGVPDFLVEILGENHEHDLKEKRKLYEAFGVKEYFIVDPTTKNVIAYYHNGEKYIQQETKLGKIKSKLLKKVFSF